MKNDKLQFWEDKIKEIFPLCLDAVKEMKANSPEWNLTWSVIIALKEYFENKESNEEDED